MRDKGTAWLNGRGRDAAGLVALWDLTHDDTLLDEAAKRFPDDTRVCMAMIDRLRSDPGAALVWTEHLIGIEPGNPAGQYLRSWALFQSGDRDGAFDAICAGVRIGGRYDTHHRDRLDTLELAMAACDLPAREAALTSLRFQQNNDCAGFTQENARALIEARMGQLSAAGDAEQLEITARVGFEARWNNGLGDKSSYSTTLAFDVAANRLECLIDSHLQDGWQITKNFITSGSRPGAFDEAPRITRLLEAAKSVPQRLESAPDDIVVEYARLVRNKSERSAIAWLVENTEPRQSSAPLLHPAAARQ